MLESVSISVVVPIYNVEQYLRECLDSLVAQTLKSIEVILVNDGSKDNSGAIAREYAEKWPKLFRYFEKENGGLSDARNFAFPYIRGKYVAFLDSDDYIAEDMYELLWNKAIESNGDIIECEFVKVYPDHNKIIELPENYKNIKDYMLNSRVGAWNKLYRVEWLNEIKTEFPKGLLYEDLSFFFKITPYLNQLPATVHKPLYFYRQREGSILNSPNRRILEIHSIFKDLISYYEERSLMDEYYITLEYKYAKTLFCSFLLRMLKIKDKTLRNEVINISWSEINGLCPNWKRNPYLHKLSIRNIYLRIISPKIISLIKLIIRK